MFETIRFQNQKLFLIDKHLSRLRTGLETIKINYNFSDELIISILNGIISKNEIQDGLIRLMVTRGELEGEPWNYAGPICIYASIRPISPMSNTPEKVVYFNESDYPIIRFNPAIKFFFKWLKFLFI